MDFIDDFIETFGGISPDPYVKWAAITAIAGALERKVWVFTKGSPLYPNVYVVFVGPPGVGKTEMTWRVQELWESLDTHHVAHTSVTKASLIDLLSESDRKITDFTADDPIYTFYSLLIASDELGVLIPAYDMEFMNTLTHLYDGKRYSESRRTNKLERVMERTNLNLLAGCTPAYLKETLPPGAWDQGFLSRTLLIYAGEQDPQSLFAVNELNERAVKNIERRLDEIGKLYGKCSFTKEAAAMIDKWHMSGGAPRPEHPRLKYYCSRRTTHVLKLSMIVSISEDTELVIHERHVRRAIELLVEMEFEIPEIFKSMASGGDSQILQEVYHFVYTTYLKEKKAPIAQHRVVRFVSERTPAHNVARILETMTAAKMLDEIPVKGVGVGYRPGAVQKII